MIRICNWLLTRKCNLDCSYCSIVKDYPEKPPEYPDISYYHKNEMSTQYILEALAKIKNHNSNCFHIFYGGEPLLRKDLKDIISFCNKNDIAYTVISNSTLKEKIVDLLQEVEVKGFSFSSDPQADGDREKKTKEAFFIVDLLKKYGVKDIVAEITIDNNNQHLLYEHVKKLSQQDVVSSITFIDIAKNRYYDFSNVKDESLLVKPNNVISEQFKKLIEDDTLQIHMKQRLLAETWKILPSNLDCEIEKDLHNLSIDADGTVRLCLRIKGTNVPSIKINDKEFFTKDFLVSDTVKTAITKDKKEYCVGCNHTCQIMSKIINEDINLLASLIHEEKRR